MSHIIQFCIFLYPLFCIIKHYNASYQIYQVTAYNYNERSLLYYLYLNKHEIIFLNGVTNEAVIPMNIIVKNNFSTDFEEYLNLNSIDYTHRDNASRSIKPMPKENHILGKKYRNVANTFLGWHEFTKWVDQKIKMYSHVNKIIIGSTYEKREIIVLRVSTGKRDAGVFITGGEEGRDWMSPAIILNVLNGMLEDKNNLSILTKYYDFYFLPFFNPDGYDYSIYQDTLWTKNRKAFFPPRKCYTHQLAAGVNIDRNWFLSKYDNDQHECRAVYFGNTPLSEEESKAVSGFLNKISVNVMAYINLRGFDRLITLPYGYTNIHSNNHQIMMEMLSSICNKLKIKHNTTYYYGSTSSLMYNFSGNSPDWVKMNLNIPIVYTVYLKYKDYLLPNVSHIAPLTKIFNTIMEDTLMFGYNIYGPLFNNQNLCQINIVVITLSMVHIIN